MRLLDYFFGFLALIGLVLTGWWGVYQSPNTPVNLEARLEANANAALEAKGYDWARVEMRGQRAVLHGKAPSADAVQAAALTVLTSSGPGGVILGGVTQVESAVDAAPPVSPYVWRAIKTPEGGFVLLGHVPSEHTRDRLVAQARAHAEGASVEDRMELAAGAPGANWQGMAGLALENLARLDSGEARLADREVRLSGLSMDSAVRAQVTADIANVTAPFRGAALIRGNTLWSARHEDGVLVIGGKVASAAERDEILAIARQYYSRDVRDEMTVEGEPHEGWMTGVRAGLPHFAGFSRGEMAFDPAGTGLSFEGDAPASTLYYLREDLSGLDGPWAATVFALPEVREAAGLSGPGFAADPVTACQQAFDTVMATHELEFTPEGALSRTSGPLLDKLAAIAQRCVGRTDIAIAGGAAPGEAAAVKNYLTAMGLDAARVTVIGYGPDRTVQGNDTAVGPAENRRVEFRVRERSE